MLAETFTPTQHAFLLALCKTGSVTQAAEACDLERTTPYHWLDRDKREGWTEEDAPEGTFMHAFQRAKSMAAEVALGRIHDIVTTTNGMPAMIGAMFTVKRWYPEYRDQLTVKSTSMNISARVDLNQLDPTERAELLRLTQRRLLLLETDAAPPSDDER